MSSKRELDDLSAIFDRERPGALLVGSDPFFIAQRNQLIGVAARYAIPSMYNERQMVVDGGLLSYGASIADGYHHAGVYAGKILNGAKPADPTSSATRSDLIATKGTANGI